MVPQANRTLFPSPFLTLSPSLPLRWFKLCIASGGSSQLQARRRVQPSILNFPKAHRQHWGGFEPPGQRQQPPRATYLYQNSTSLSKSSVLREVIPSGTARPLASRTPIHVCLAAALIALPMILLPWASKTTDCQPSVRAR